MPQNNETTTKFKVDISELKKGIQDAQRQIRLANAEFKAASSGMDDWSKSADGISAKLKQLDTTLKSQKTVLGNLEEQYKAVAAEQGESSKGAQELAIKIANQKAAINKTEKEIKNYEQALADVGTESKDVEKSSGKAAKGIKDVADESKEAEKSTSGLADGLANLAKKGFAAIGTAAAGAVTGFFASAEATREFREAAGKVDTAFTNMGFSAEQGAQTFDDFYAICGDTDRATEAVGNLAKLAKSQEDLNDWTTIATGVWGTFGDGLPIEGLTEAANETAKVAKVTGPLADALNWATTDSAAWSEALSGNAEALAAFEKATGEGMNAEDAFNEALLVCNDEQERSQLITSTLTSLYGDAAKQYEETNGSIMDANRAQNELNQAMSGVGAAAEPVMSTLKLFGASILTDILPGVEDLGSALTDLMNGTEGAGDAVGSALSELLTTALNKIVELLPMLIETGLSLVTNLIQGILSALPTLATTAIEIVTTLLDGLSTAIPEIVLAVVEIIPQIIDALIAGIPQLIAGAIQFLLSIVEAIPTVIQAITTALPSLITSIINALVSAQSQLMEGAITLLMAIVEAIPEIITSLTDALPLIIDSIITGLLTAAPQLLAGSIKLLMALVEAIPQIVSALLKALPQIIKAILQGLSGLPKLLQEFFTTIWTKNIQGVFKDVGTWFSKKFKEAFTAIKQAFSGVASWASGIWSSITSVFNSVATWFGNKFKQAWNNIKDAFSGFTGFFRGLWDDITGIFKAVGTAIGDAISGSVKSAVNTVLKGAIGIINGFISSINTAIGIINKIPGVEISKLNKLDVPQLEKGGILKRGQVGLLEGNGSEAVVPLDQNKKWIAKTAQDMARALKNENVIAGNNNTATNYTFNQYNNSPKALSRLEIYRQTKNQLQFAKGV